MNGPSKLLVDSSETIKIPANTSKMIETLDLSEAMEAFGKRNLLLWLELTVDKQVVSTNLVTLAPPKHIDLPQPGITAEIVSHKDGDFSVTLTAAQPALWTWLEIDGVDAMFSDNFIHLPPGVSRTIEISPHQPITVAEMKIRLLIRSLWDTYE